MRNIRQNLFFACIYNALDIPIAAGAMYPFFGVLLSPMIAGARVSLRSVSVITNALRLRHAKLGKNIPRKEFCLPSPGRKGKSRSKSLRSLKGISARQ
jgi:hypothetical protein